MERKFELLDLLEPLKNRNSEQGAQIKDLINELKINLLDKKNTVDPVQCIGCKALVQKVHNNAELYDKVHDILYNIFEYGCQYATDYAEGVCSGIVKDEVPYLNSSLWDHYINGEYLCALLEICEQKYENIDIDALIVDILSDKPENEPLVPKSSKTLKFMHISDVHTDVRYLVGGNTECNKPSCCRADSGVPSEEAHEAKYWGTLRHCDIPVKTFNKFVEFLRDNVADELEFALWTGDNTSHNIWNQSYEQNIENTRQQTEQFKKEIPDLQFIPINGNHESFPVDVYAWYGDKELNFNNFMADQWGDWIGEQAAEQLRNQGYYETILDKFNLKVIALNTQACDKDNLTLIRDPTDPGDVLQNLRKSLYESEQNDQPVYIIGHIPSGEYCSNTWARIYTAIIDRFSYTIRGHFTGHTHNDQFQIIYNKEGKAVNVNWIAPSVTTFPNRNPEFRVFEVDSETFQIVNFYQYKLDIEYYNQFKDDNIKMYYEIAYDFVSEYNLPNMWDLQNVVDLSLQVKNDLDVFNKYMKNYFGVYEYHKDEIKPAIYCEMCATDELTQICNGKTYTPFFTEIVAGPWKQKIGEQKFQL